MVTQSYYRSDPRVRREAETAAANGMMVDVISLKKEGQEKKLQLNGVTVYGIALSKKRGGFWRYVFEYLVFLAASSFMLTALHLRRRYELIQIHTLPDFLVFCAIIPRLSGARVVLDMHEVMPEFFASKFNVRKNHLFIRVITFLEKISIKFADHLITVNDPIAKLLENRGVPDNKITVVMNSVDENLFTPAIRHIRNKEREGYNLMYHGTLTEIYGLDIAMKALVLIKEQIPDVRLHIYGDGPLRSSLTRLAQELHLSGKVIFHGRVPLENIPEHLMDCDLGVLPTRQDEFLDLSFSNKLVEYVFASKPVVSSRLRTTMRYFRESSISYFTPHDPAELAACVIALHDDPQKSSAQVISALQDYRKIDWNIMRQRYLDLLGQITRSAGEFSDVTLGRQKRNR